MTVRDVSERYGCSGPTARKYIRQMFHYETPLAAPQWAFREWEESRERMPAGASTRRKVEIQHRKDQGRIIVPRKREG